MDSSDVGVGVAVLVGKCMQGPCSAVPDIRSIKEHTFLTVSYCSQISMHLVPQYKLFTVQPQYM